MKERLSMKRKVLVVCCVLLSATSMLAQSRGGKADPFSGTWKGELDVPQAPAPVAITMELKFDGKTAVTGTFSGLPNPGDVKSGTFNPKTGALKLELGKKGDSEVRLVLEGTVVKGTATGQVTGEAGIGKFKIARKEKT
jgi:hypothetical protein